jgi:hypothetical protein
MSPWYIYAPGFVTGISTMEAFLAQHAVGASLQTDANKEQRAGVACCESSSNVADLAAPGTIDGRAVAADDRVLLTAQSSGAENGLYVANSGVALVRPADAKAGEAMDEGTLVYVVNGAANGDKYFKLTAAVTAIGTAAQTWAEFTAAPTAGSTVTLPAGTVAAPALAFTDDTNTGAYRPGADSFGVATAGAAHLVVDDNGGAPTVTVSKGELLLRNGTAAAPALAFAADADLGLYRAGAESLAVATDGSAHLTVDDDDGTTTSVVQVNKGYLQLGAGTEAVPAVVFADKNDGIYRTANQLHFTAGGGTRFAVAAGYAQSAEPLWLKYGELAGLNFVRLSGTTQPAATIAAHARGVGAVRGGANAYLAYTVDRDATATTLAFDVAGDTEFGLVPGRFTGSWFAVYNGSALQLFGEITGHTVSGTDATITYAATATATTAHEVRIYVAEFKAPAVNWQMTNQTGSDYADPGAAESSTTDRNFGVCKSAGGMSDNTTAGRVLLQTTVAAGASATSFTLASDSNVSGTDDNYNGLYVRFISGTAGNIGNVVRVQDYVASTRTITCAALAATPSASDGVQILRPDVVSVWFDKDNNVFKFAEYDSDEAGYGLQHAAYTNHAAIDGATWLAPTLSTRDPAAAQDVATKSYVDGRPRATTFRAGGLVTSGSKNNTISVTEAHDTVLTNTDFALGTNHAVYFSAGVGSASVAATASESTANASQLTDGTDFDVIGLAADGVYMVTVHAAITANGSSIGNSGVTVVLYSNSTGATEVSDASNFSASGGVITHLVDHPVSPPFRSSSSFSFVVDTGAAGGARFFAVMVSRDDADGNDLTFVAGQSMVHVLRLS